MQWLKPNESNDIVEGNFIWQGLMRKVDLMLSSWSPVKDLLSNSLGCYRKLINIIYIVKLQN